MKAKKLNKYFKSDEFVLIMVQYHEDGQEYTYAAPASLDIEVGSFVIVPQGEDVDVFSESNTIDFLTIAEVTDITTDKKYLPKDYPIKCIVGSLPSGAGKVYSKHYKKRWKQSKK